MHISAKVLLGIGVVLAVGCKSTDSQNTDVAGSNWSGKMQGMAADVKDLLPYIYDKDAYSKEANRPTVQAKLNQFAKQAHTINPETAKGLGAEDPIVQFSLDNLNGDLQRAASSYSQGQYEYSRFVAKSAVNNCFTCHSVTQVGASAPWNLEDIHNLQLAPTEKVDLLIATRKYDQALAFLVEKLNSESLLKNAPFDFEALLRRYIALMIRIKKDPAHALAELDRISKSPNTPHYIAEQISGWRKSLKEWQKEKAQSNQQAKAILNSAKKRFANAKKIQSFEKDHRGDVEFLRVTSILHQGYPSLKNVNDQAEALYLLGNAYEVLDELGSWNLHEAYYEVCIRKAPKTALANKCFQKLEASVMMGYSGSAGTNIPSDERARLDGLKSLVK